MTFPWFRQLHSVSQICMGGADLIHTFYIRRIVTVALEHALHIEAPVRLLNLVHLQNYRYYPGYNTALLLSS